MEKVYRLFSTVVVLILLIAQFSSVQADTVGTVAGGPVSANTTWTKASSPYHVTSSIDILAGATLTIEPGVVVKFAPAKLIQVHGALIARGTADQRIVFTSDSSTPKPGDWAQIDLSPAPATVIDGSGSYQSGSLLQNCVVEYAGNGDMPAVKMTSQMIDHCSIRHNKLSGIYVIGTASANGWVTNNEVFDHHIFDLNGGGIFAKYARLLGNTVYGNDTHALAGSGWTGYGAGIYAVYSTVTGNDIHDNAASYGGGLYVENSTVSTNTVSNNLASDISGRGGGILAKNSLIAKNTVTGNKAGSAYGAGNGGGIHATDSTVDGNTVSGNVANSESKDTFFGGQSYGGGIYADNTTVSNNTVIGNRAYSSQPSVSMQGGGIYADGGTVKQNVIAMNSVQGSRLYGSGLYTQGAATVTQNTFAHNTCSGGITGAYYIWGVSSFHYNWFTRNAPYDVFVGTSSNIDGTLNYWEVSESTGILNRVFDWYDSSVLGKLTYDPFLKAPDSGAPQPPVFYLNYIPVVRK